MQSTNFEYGSPYLTIHHIITLRHTHTHTCVGRRGFVVNPLDDLEAVLSRYDSDSRDAGDEVL